MPMHSQPECLPCILSQVISTARRVSDDDWVVAKVTKQAMEAFADADLERSPAELSFDALRAATRILGSQDPYADEKRRYNRKILALLPRLRKEIESSDNPLLAAVRYSLAGNIIDLGIGSRFDLDQEVEQAKSIPLAIDAFADLEPAVKSADKIMIILDNCGEAAFDRLLIEQLRGRDIVAVVRKKPIINDVTAEDARDIGIDQFARILDPSQDMLGVVLPLASEGFRREFYSADVVISKGQANLETLHGVDRDVFFLLRAKCPVVARELGVEEGSTVLYHYQPSA
ncbi:MAG: DUF89 family protein [Planctomycetes bacterium]|nr:DUF89 family protein [Planctomycetota bacterium]